MGTPRFEQKFIAGVCELDFAAAWLGHVCLPDPEFPEGTVYSVYYDTPALDAYEQKNSGDFSKTKVRLRWYDPDISRDAESRTVFLEVKSKAGDRGLKARRSLTVQRRWIESAELDDEGFTRLLAGQQPSLENELSASLMPLASIRYCRSRFVCPASLARVCLDSSIEVVKTNSRLLPTLSPGRVDMIVVEVKHPGRPEIPWLKALYDRGFRRSGFSKYGECIARLIGEE